MPKKVKCIRILSTPQFDSRLPVVAVRAIYNKAHDEFSRMQFDLLSKLENNEISRQDAQMQVESFWVGSLKEAVIDGDVENGSLMAGQSIGLVKKEQTVEEIMNEMIVDIETELLRIQMQLWN